MLSRKQIRECLMLNHDMRQVTEYHLDVVQFLLIHPKAKPIYIQRELQDKMSRSGVYKTVNRLVEVKAINRYNQVTLKTDGLFEDNPYWPMANIVKDKLLPPPEFKYVHIAAKAAKLDVDEQFEFFEKFKADVDLNSDILLLINQMYNGLAFCALMAGDVTNFTNMTGTINNE